MEFELIFFIDRRFDWLKLNSDPMLGCSRGEWVCGMRICCRPSAASRINSDSVSRIFFIPARTIPNRFNFGIQSHECQKRKLALISFVCAHCCGRSEYNKFHSTVTMRSDAPNVYLEFQRCWWSSRSCFARLLIYRKFIKRWFTTGIKFT